MAGASISASAALMIRQCLAAATTTQQFIHVLTQGDMAKKDHGSNSLHAMLVK
jgi:hypothetical protein